MHNLLLLFMFAADPIPVCVPHQVHMDEVMCSIKIASPAKMPGETYIVRTDKGGQFEVTIAPGKTSTEWMLYKTEKVSTLRRKVVGPPTQVRPTQKKK